MPLLKCKREKNFVSTSNISDLLSWLIFIKSMQSQMSQIQGAEIPHTLELESILTPTGRDALGNCPLRESVRGCPCGPCGPCGPTTRTTFSSASLFPHYGGQPPTPVTTVFATYILRPSSPCCYFYRTAFTTNYFDTFASVSMSFGFYCYLTQDSSPNHLCSVYVIRHIYIIYPIDTTPGVSISSGLLSQCPFPSELVVKLQLQP